MNSPSTSSGRQMKAVIELNSEPKVQVCDATEEDSSTNVDIIKIIRWQTNFLRTE